MAANPSNNGELRCFRKQLLSSDGFFDAERWNVYRSTFRIVWDHPWLGTALGTFRWAFPRYRTAEIGISGIWEQAHSTTLEIASEMGTCRVFPCSFRCPFPGNVNTKAGSNSADRGLLDWFIGRSAVADRLFIASSRIFASRSCPSRDGACSGKIEPVIIAQEHNATLYLYILPIL